MKARSALPDLSLAVLGLLRLRPLSGYGVRKVFLTTAMAAFSASPGAIYPALLRLEKDGLVSGIVENRETLRPRRVFAVTAKGRAALVAALTAPVGRADVIRGMDRLLLRFSFMSGLVPDRETSAFLRAMEGAIRRYLDEFGKEVRAYGPGLPFSGRAALEHGLASFRTTLLWARRTRASLDRRVAKKGETP